VQSWLGIFVQISRFLKKLENEKAARILIRAACYFQKALKSI